MSQEPQQSTEYNYSKRQIAIGLVAIFSVYATMAYFVQSLNVARPKMAAQLNGMDLYSWSISIPALASAFATLIFGKFSDMYGRRIMLMVSLCISLVGTVLSAISPNFVFLIVASVISLVGTGAMMPLVFSVVGDLFPPSRRSKWIGLLNIPVGILAVVGPLVGGWLVDNWSWRYLYWVSLPLLFVCLITVPIGVPSIRSAIKGKIDIPGCILAATASGTLIIGFSIAGDMVPWSSWVVIGLLVSSLICWVFFFKVEANAKEPILDPIVLRNRSFLTIAVSGLFSFLGQVGIMMYLPMFLQGVQDKTALLTAWIIIPFGALMSLIGVPVGFLLARSKRYKWMYVSGYGLLTLVMFAFTTFGEKTSIVWIVLAVTLAGLSLGAVPTVNTVVVQNAIPKRLLGVAMGAVFFNLMMGVAISPAILGSAWNSAYAQTLSVSLPEELKQITDKEVRATLGNSRVLLDADAKARLEKMLGDMGEKGKMLFQPTFNAIRTSMEAGLRRTFLIGAIAMLVSFCIICTIPEISIAVEAKKTNAPDASVSSQPVIEPSMPERGK